MQPVQSPEEYQINWLHEKGLADPAAIQQARQRLQAAMGALDLTATRIPTLLSVLADMGRLTRAQCDEGERETERRRNEFMSWRSQAMAEEARMREALDSLQDGPPPPRD